MIRALPFLLLTVAIPSAARPLAWQQPARAVDRDVDSLLERIRLEWKVPSLVGAVIKGGQVVARGAVGFRRAGGTERVTVGDKFHLGSDTKAMTATLIAVLVEEGRLSWSTTVGDIFGPVISKMDPGWRGVTLEQLVRHRGGAPGGADFLTAMGDLWPRIAVERSVPLVEQRLQMVEAMVTRPPSAAPMTKYIYSNGGYVIAGAMAEKVTGRAWEELMKDKLFVPLGITSGGFGPPGKPDTASPDQPWGHRPNGTAAQPGSPGSDNPAALGPAGTVHMTIGDWAKFVVAHLRGSPKNPARRAQLLKPEGYEALHRPIENYAGGWGIAGEDRPTYDGLILQHNGSNTMWFASVWLFPEIDVAVLTIANQGGNAGAKATGAAAFRLFEKFK